MQLPNIDGAYLWSAGLLIGGILAGIIGFKRLPVTRNSNPNNPKPEPEIEKSQKTSGALHISEEALGKIDAIKTEMKDDYLTIKYHKALCRGNLAELGSEISKEITDAIERSEKRIIKAFNGEKD